MSAAIDRMAHVGEMPWHQNSTYIGENEVTAQEMMEAAGMDWTVSVSQMMYQKPDQTLVPVPNAFAIIRDDNGAVLGRCSGRYEPLFNRDAFAFFDPVVEEGLAMYHTAGSLGNGERIWILAKLPAEYDLRIAGVDVVENFILLVNGFDANTAFQMMWTPIRVVCQNTLNVATDHGRSTAGYRLNHLGGIRNKLNVADARIALGLAAEQIRSFNGLAQLMAQTPVTAETIAALCQRLFPSKLLLAELPAPQADNLLLLPEPDMAQYQTLHPATFEPHIYQKRDIITTLAAKGVGNENPEIAGTRWTLFNAVAEYADYVRGWESRRTRNLLFGSGRDLKQQAWDLLKS